MRFNSYKVNQKHRGKNPTEKASMWAVTEWLEIQLFSTASLNGWNSDDKDILWSISATSCIHLKIGDAPSKSLFIAKFCCDNNMEWHGYPVYPRGDDIPPERVLELWRINNLIDKTDKRRIQKGQFKS